MGFPKIEPLIAQMVEHETVDLVVACSSHARRIFCLMAELWLVIWPLFDLRWAATNEHQTCAVKTNDQAVWSKHIKKSLKLDRSLTELDSLDQRGSNNHLTTTRKSKVGEEFQRQLTIQINNTIPLFTVDQKAVYCSILRSWNHEPTVLHTDETTRTQCIHTGKATIPTTDSGTSGRSEYCVGVPSNSLLNRSGIAFGGERHTTGPSRELVERVPVGTLRAGVLVCGYITQQCARFYVVTHVPRARRWWSIHR